MRKRRNVVLGIALLSGLAIACGSGSGPLASIGDGYDQPPNSRENPGTTRESPSTTGRDIPPVTGDNPGTQGGGTAGASTCPPCDQKFDCLAVQVSGSRTETDEDDLTLRTINGVCSAGDGVVLDCSGRVLVGSLVVGTWQASGAGFAAVVSVQGRTTTLTCTKRASSSQTGGGDTQVPTPEPAPPITDAGTRG